MHSLKNDVTKEVTHLAHLPSPNMIPFDIMKNMHIPAKHNEMIYATILHHQGSCIFFFLLTITFV
jgi:hypothetical protein